MSVALLVCLLAQGVAVQLEEADKLFGQRRYAEALEAYRKTAEEAGKAGDRRVEVEALAQVTRCHTVQGKIDEARPWLERTAKLASKDEPLGWSRYLRSKGLVERESGDRPKAKKTFEELYAYCVERKLHQRAVDAVHHIAIVAKPEEQPGWALKGIAEAEKLRDDGMLAVLWNNLGGSYEDLKQYDKCLEAYLKAREYHGKSGDDRRKFVADWAVGHAQRLVGRHHDARDLLEKTLAWAQKRHGAKRDDDTTEWLGWCKKDLGETLAALGERERGLTLLREARAHLVEVKIAEWGADMLKKLDESISAVEAGK